MPLRTARASIRAENFAEMGMPVTTTSCSAAPRATRRALVCSVATQYKSTHGFIHQACASKSVTMLTAKGCALGNVTATTVKSQRGKVIAQAKKPGTKLPYGAKVGIRVAV